MIFITFIFYNYFERELQDLDKFGFFICGCLLGSTSLLLLLHLHLIASHHSLLLWLHHLLSCVQCVRACVRVVRVCVCVCVVVHAILPSLPLFPTHTTRIRTLHWLLLHHRLLCCFFCPCVTAISSIKK